MSLTIKGRPIHFSLKWLRPPPTPPDGSMTLFEHLRELRYRLVVASLAILVGMIVAWFFRDYLMDILQRPYFRAVEDFKAKNPEAETLLVNINVTSPLTLALKVSALAGMVVTAPIWLYQVWAFVVPGLLAREKKWTLIFLAAASPMFAAGVFVGYFVLPKGISVLLSFTQVGVSNLQNVNDYLSFLMRVMVVFGIAFVIPLLVLMLNIIGVVKASQLVQVPDPGHLQHLRLRRRGHPVDRSVLHARPGRADDPALPGRRGHRAHPGSAQGPARPDRTWWSRTASVTTRRSTSSTTTRPGEPADPPGGQPFVG